MPCTRICIAATRHTTTQTCVQGVRASSLHRAARRAQREAPRSPSHRRHCQPSPPSAAVKRAHVSSRRRRRQTAPEGAGQAAAQPIVEGRSLSPLITAVHCGRAIPMKRANRDLTSEAHCK
ncbi:unnamed protein product [Pleuronectes platessa]|uniref:Uncharacterized protein n=1 Tax=Pleuronectes platessa TaxID=8262 RepID=A0A9N7Z852_PLEPL|nr:unnamed protein product [Pleuronectes platessa]